MQDDHGLLLFETDGPIATITLNRPERKNAVLFAMRSELAALCERINDDPAIRVAILTGRGGDFCSGADVSEMGLAGIDGASTRARHMYRLITTLAGVRKPLIGAVRGVALGMGLSMALACDYIVAGESLRMGCVQRKIGLCPDAGNVWYLSRLIGIPRAKELVFSGRMVEAHEALELGLVGTVVPDEQVAAKAREVVATLTHGPTLALSVAKRMFDRALNSSLEEFMDFESSCVPLVAQSIDFKEGTRAFREKRQPGFVGE
jgi:2-(1,2-epoxy-1,2-dihydrophenyl)acetyl-CoA isomerase